MGVLVVVDSAAQRQAAGGLPGAGVVAVRFPGQPHAYRRLPHVAQTLDQIATACAGLRLRHTGECRTVGFAAGGAQTLRGADVALATGLEVLNPEHAVATLGPGGAIELELTVGADSAAEANAGLVPLRPRLSPLARWSERGRWARVETDGQLSAVELIARLGATAAPNAPWPVAPAVSPWALLLDPIHAPVSGLVESVTANGLRIGSVELPFPDYRRCGDVLQPSRLLVTTGWEVSAGALLGGYEEAAAELVVAAGSSVAVSEEVAHGLLSRLEPIEVGCAQELLDRSLAPNPARLDHRGVAYQGAGARPGDVLLACRPEPVLCPAGADAWQVIERHETADDVRLVLIARRPLAVGDELEVLGERRRVEAVVPAWELPPCDPPAHLTWPGARSGEPLLVSRV